MSEIFQEGIYLAKVTQRQAPIGTDRNHSRYWVFSDVTPGLFVEKGRSDLFEKCVLEHEKRNLHNCHLAKIYMWV